MSLSPLPPQQSFPASPSSASRKRSIHDIEDTTLPSPGHKRPLIDYNAENQENCDPSLTIPSKDLSAPLDRPVTLPPPPSVEITVRASDLVVMSGSKETTLGCISSSEADPLPPPTSSSPKKSESASTPAAKKRKLSPASQDAKQQEKEARERQKLEEKAKKEEEKRVKAEEKKKRDEEREEEKRQKEEEKKKREAEREEKRKAKDEEKAAKEAAKEEEKKRKEEEKLKKERVCTPEGLDTSGTPALTCLSRLNPNLTLSSQNPHYLPSPPDLHQEISLLRKRKRRSPRSLPSQTHPSQTRLTTKRRSRNFFSSLILNSHPRIDLSVTQRLFHTSVKNLMPL